jgi:hypothetical protein
MSAIKPSGLEKILSRKASTAPFGPTSMRSTLARRRKAERREARADFRVGTALGAVAHPTLAIPRFEPRCKPDMRRMTHQRPEPDCSGKRPEINVRPFLVAHNRPMNQ